MSENNNVNYGFDNTLCSVDVSSQGVGEIDINRVCEEIDKSKIQWIDAREKLPKKRHDAFLWQNLLSGAACLRAGLGGGRLQGV